MGGGVGEGWGGVVAALFGLLHNARGRSGRGLAETM